MSCIPKLAALVAVHVLEGTLDIIGAESEAVLALLALALRNQTGQELVLGQGRLGRLRGVVVGARLRFLHPEPLLLLSRVKVGMLALARVGRHWLHQPLLQLVPIDGPRVVRVEDAEDIALVGAAEDLLEVVHFERGAQLLEVDLVRTIRIHLDEV